MSTDRIRRSENVFRVFEENEEEHEEERRHGSGSQGLNLELVDQIQLAFKAYLAEVGSLEDTLTDFEDEDAELSRTGLEIKRLTENQFYELYTQSEPDVQEAILASELSPAQLHLLYQSQK